MGYHLPDDDRVAQAAARVLAREATVPSQRALAERVRHQLQQQDPRLRVSERRVRRVVLERGLAKLTVETGTTQAPPPETCPVCGEDLVQVKNRTLTDQETVVGARCPACPYRAGAHYEVPLQYGFTRTQQALANGKEVKGPF